MNNLKLVFLILLISFKVNAQLVAYYPFNGDAIDISGNGHDAILNNAILCTDRFGEIDKAYYFDGFSLIGVSDHEALRPNKITVSLWFQLETGSIKDVLFKGDNSFGSDGNYRIRVGYNGVGSYLQDGSNCIFPDAWVGGQSPNINLGNCWTHVAFTYDGFELVLYMNGIKVFDNLVEVPFSMCTNGPLVFGCSGTNSIDYFKGKIDDIRIYNEALDESSINDIYNTELPDVIICEFDDCMSVSNSEVSALNKSIELYPNPVNKVLFLEYKNHLDGIIRIISVEGKIIREKIISNDENFINLEELSAGIYFVHIISNMQTISQKIIKR